MTTLCNIHNFLIASLSTACATIFIMLLMTGMPNENANRQSRFVFADEMDQPTLTNSVEAQASLKPTEVCATMPEVKLPLYWRGEYAPDGKAHGGAMKVSTIIPTEEWEKDELEDLLVDTSRDDVEDLELEDANEDMVALSSLSADIATGTNDEDAFVAFSGLSADTATAAQVGETFPDGSTWASLTDASQDSRVVVVFFGYADQETCAASTKAFSVAVEEVNIEYEMKKKTKPNTRSASLVVVSHMWPQSCAIDQKPCHEDHNLLSMEEWQGQFTDMVPSVPLLQDVYTVHAWKDEFGGVENGDMLIYLDGHLFQYLPAANHGIEEGDPEELKVLLLEALDHKKSTNWCKSEKTVKTEEEQDEEEMELHQAAKAAAETTAQETPKKKGFGFFTDDFVNDDDSINNDDEDEEESTTVRKTGGKSTTLSPSSSSSSVPLLSSGTTSLNSLTRKKKNTDNGASSSWYNNLFLACFIAACITFTVLIAKTLWNCCCFFCAPYGFFGYGGYYDFRGGKRRGRGGRFGSMRRPSGHDGRGMFQMIGRQNGRGDYYNIDGMDDDESDPWLCEYGMAFGDEEEDFESNSVEGLLAGMGDAKRGGKGDHEGDDDGSESSASMKRAAQDFFSAEEERYEEYDEKSTMSASPAVADAK